jgi:hypothetical protein
LPWVGYSTDAGLFIGGGPSFERYGFRHHPYAFRTSLLGGYATGVNKWRAEFSADMRRESSDAHLTVTARVSELDVLHFYGFGNETPSQGSNSFHRVEQRAAGIEPMMHVPLERRLTLDLGVSVRRTKTVVDSGEFIASVNPFGVGTFGQVGARAGLTFDSRDNRRQCKARRVRVISGRAVSRCLERRGYVRRAARSGGDLSERPGSIRAGARASSGRRESVGQLSVLRCGGDRRWLDAARLATGALRRRCVAVWECGASFLLTKFFLLLPGDLGVFGLADAGRVYLSGESSDTWHSAFGGGLWFRFLVAPTR